MKISSNNHMADPFTSFIVNTDADAGQDISDLTNGDFSTAYTSAGSAATFSFTKVFTTAFDCKYVAIAGHNFSDIGGNLIIKVNNVEVLNTSFVLGLEPNRVIMAHFDIVSCANMSITYTKTLSPDRVSINYVSIGDTLDSVFAFPEQNNEQSGFPKNWRTRSENIRATINNIAQPVAYVRQRISRKATLTLNNISISTIETAEWLDFLNSVYNGGDFFIKETDGTGGTTDNPKSGTMCFAADIMPPKTHAATRQLVNLAFKFSTYTGS